MRLELRSGYSRDFDPFPLYSPERGWNDLVVQLFIDLVALGWDRRLLDVKDKRGGLRVYVLEATEEVDARIHRAMNEAKQTCRRCGHPGILCDLDEGMNEVICDWCDRPH